MPDTLARLRPDLAQSNVDKRLVINGKGSVMTVSASRIFAGAIALSLAACAEAPPPTPAGTECAVGLYGTPGERFIAITRREDGYRYAFQGGEIDAVNAEDARVACVDEGLLVDGEDIWPPMQISETSTRFASGDLSLAGLLLEPANAEPDTPLVVYAHGSERMGWLEAFRDPYLMVGRGVSVFVYDKRGTGASEGTYTQNFNLLADDLVAASTEARRLAEGRYGRFGLFGLSQGGWIAPMAATRAGAEFLGVGYGLMITVAEEDAEQVFKELRELGYGDDVIEKAREVTDATALIAASGYEDGHDELRAAREKYGQEPWFADIRGEFSGVLMSIPEAELRERGVPEYDAVDIDWSLDPVEIIRTVNIPQLWVLAEEDREAPMSVTLERLSALRDDGKDIAMWVFPDTDHGMWEFEETDDGERDYTRVTEGYYDLLADWAKGGLDERYGAGRRE